MADDLYVAPSGYGLGGEEERRRMYAAEPNPDDPDVAHGASSSLHQGQDPDIVSGGSAGDLGPQWDVLGEWREKFPRYKEVPDEQLAAEIAQKFPRYRDALQPYLSSNQIPVIDTRRMAAQASQEGAELPKTALDTADEKLAMATRAISTPAQMAKAGAGKVGKFVGEVEQGLPWVSKALAAPGEAAGLALGETAAMAPEAARPILSAIGRGVSKFGGALVSPTNVAIGAAAAAVPEIQVPVSLGFGAQMAADAVQKSPELKDAVKHQDWPRVAELATTMGLQGVAAAIAGVHGAVELRNVRMGAKIAADAPPPTKPVEEPPVAESPQVDQLRVTAEELANPPKPLTERQQAVRAARAANDQAAADVLNQQEAQRQAGRKGVGQAEWDIQHPPPPPPAAPGLESLQMPTGIDLLTLQGMIPEFPYEPTEIPPVDPHFLAELKQLEAQNGYVEPHSLSPDLREEIKGEVGISRLQEILDLDVTRDLAGKRVWKDVDEFNHDPDSRESDRIMGHKSPVPKPFQGVYTFDKLSKLLIKGLRGEKLGPAANLYFLRLKSYYGRSTGSPPDEDAILRYAAAHGFDIKTKSIWEQEQQAAQAGQEREAIQAPPEQGETGFDPVELERQAHLARAEAGHKAADELEGMGAKEAAAATREHAHASEALAQALEEHSKPDEPPVVKNPPATPGLQDEAAFELGVRGIKAENPDEVSELAAQYANLKKPVTTTTGEVPVSKSTEFPDRYQADLAGGKPYEAVHEVSHMEEAENPPGTVEDRGKQYGRGEGQGDLFADLERTAQSANSVVRGKAGAAPGGFIGGVRVRASALLERFRNRGYIEFRGQHAPTAADIAVIAQVARDPRTETYRLFLLDKNDDIIAGDAVSSGLPHVVKPAGWIPEDHAFDPDYIIKLKARMQRIGAVSYFALHNHPSGRGEASPGDLAVTDALAKQLPGFRGHVIIDHGEYAVIENIPYPGGKMPANVRVLGRQVRAINHIEMPKGVVMAENEPMFSPEARRSRVESQLGIDKSRLVNVLADPRIYGGRENAENVARLGLELKSPDKWVTLIYQDNKSIVRGVDEMPVNLFNDAENAGKFLRGRARDHGAANIAAYASPGTPVSLQAGARLVKEGYIYDLVHARDTGGYYSAVMDYGATKSPFKELGLSISPRLAGGGQQPVIRIQEPPPEGGGWESDYAKWMAEHGEEEPTPEAAAQRPPPPEPPPAPPGAPPAGEPPPPPPGAPPPGGGTPEGPGANDKLLGKFLDQLRGGPEGHFWNRSQQVKTDLGSVADSIVRTAYQNQIVNEQSERIGQQGTIGAEGTLEGGKAARATREKFRELPVKPSTYQLLFSQEQIAHVNAMIDQGMTLAKAFAADVQKFGDPISSHASKAMDRVMEDLTKQMVTLRYAAGRAVGQFDRMGKPMAKADLVGLSPEVLDNLQALGRLADGLRDAKIRRPIYTNIYESLKHWGELDPGQKQVLWRNIVDAFRLNMFSVTSFTLDMITNMGELSGQLAEAGGRDLYSLSKGQVFPNLRGFMQALKWGDWNKDVMAQLKGPSIGGELINAPRLPGMEEPLTRSEEMFNQAQKWGTFTERSNLASKIVDSMVGTPLYAKGYFDQAAAHIASQAALFAEANKAMPEGLSPVQRQLFRREFVQNPPAEVVQRALEQGNKAKFNRPLTALEENIGNSVAWRLAGDVFARWPFQFTRWFGEMIGVDPAGMRKVFPRGWSNAANPGGFNAEAAAGYLAKAATGLGGLYMLNQTMYNHVDFHSMEYVDDEGNRYRLTGREPLPTALTALALFRAVTTQDADEWEKFRSALQFSSVPFGKITTMTGGLISSLTKASSLADASKKIDPGGLARNISDALNAAIPGQALLSTMKTFMDPTVREGFGGKLPGFSFLKPAVHSPTTGQELQPQQSLLGVGPFRSIGGVPIPGAKRELDPVYRLLMRFGSPVYRGPQTAIVGQPSGALEDLEAAFRAKAGLIKMPDKETLRREFEEELGHERQYLLQPIAARLAPATPDATGASRWKIGDSEPLDYEQMRRFIGKRDAVAAKMASKNLMVKYGVMPKVQRQPTLRELQGPVSWLKDLQGAQEGRQEEINQARE